MPEHSRRSFLRTGSISAIAVGAAALTPGLLTGPADASPAAAGPLPDGPLIAYVKDHKSGEIAVMVGEREVLYRDRDLAARLARIGSHAPRS